MRRSISWIMLMAGLWAAPRLEIVGRLDDPENREASGIVRSRKYPGIYWVHNDSGNPPALFAVNRGGKLVRSFRVEVPNIDWEDIATDDEGHLFLGDIGNNNLRLPLRAIYRLDEPDPARPDESPLKPSLITYYRFPPGGRFDAEGLFLSGGRAMVVSKRFDGQEAEVFAIPLRPPAPLLHPATPDRVARLPGCVEPVTGADLSADGRRLAVSTTSAARVYLPFGDGGWSLESTVRYAESNVEAICWDGDDLILASEDRSIYRISGRQWRAAGR